MLFSLQLLGSANAWLKSGKILPSLYPKSSQTPGLFAPPTATHPAKPPKNSPPVGPDLSRLSQNTPPAASTPSTWGDWGTSMINAARETAPGMARLYDAARGIGNTPKVAQAIVGVAKDAAKNIKIVPSDFSPNEKTPEETLAESGQPAPEGLRNLLDNTAGNIAGAMDTVVQGAGNVVKDKAEQALAAAKNVEENISEAGKKAIAAVTPKGWHVVPSDLSSENSTQQPFGPTPKSNDEDDLDKDIAKEDSFMDSMFGGRFARQQFNDILAEAGSRVAARGIVGIGTGALNRLYDRTFGDASKKPQRTPKGKKEEIPYVEPLVHVPKKLTAPGQESLPLPAKPKVAPKAATPAAPIVDAQRPDHALNEEITDMVRLANIGKRELKIALLDRLDQDFEITKLPTKEQLQAIEQDVLASLENLYTNQTTIDNLKSHTTRLIKDLKTRVATAHANLGNLKFNHQKNLAGINQSLALQG